LSRRAQKPHTAPVVAGVHTSFEQPRALGSQGRKCSKTLAHALRQSCHSIHFSMKRENPKAANTPLPFTLENLVARVTKLSETHQNFEETQKKQIFIKITPKTSPPYLTSESSVISLYF